MIGRPGDHVMLDSCNFASFPADPKQVTVRTAACDLESRDSRPAELTHQLLEEIRTGMMLTECEQARKTSPDLDAVSLLHNFLRARATCYQFLPRDAMQARPMSSCGVRPSVRPSIRPSGCLLLRLRILSKRINISLKFFSPSGIHAIFIFSYQTTWQYSDGNPMAGASNAGGVGTNRDSGRLAGYRSMTAAVLPSTDSYRTDRDAAGNLCLSQPAA